MVQLSRFDETFKDNFVEELLGVTWESLQEYGTGRRSATSTLTFLAGRTITGVGERVGAEAIDSSPIDQFRLVHELLSTLFVDSTT